MTKYVNHLYICIFRSFVRFMIVYIACNGFIGWLIYLIHKSRGLVNSFKVLSVKPKAAYRHEHVRDWALTNNSVYSSVYGSPNRSSLFLQFAMKRFWANVSRFLVAAQRGWVCSLFCLDGQENYHLVRTTKVIGRVGANHLHHNDVSEMAIFKTWRQYTKKSRYGINEIILYIGEVMSSDVIPQLRKHFCM